MPVFLDDIDLIGKEVPLKFMIGEFVDLLFEIVDDANQPVDITGRIYTGLIGPGGGASATWTLNQVEEDYATGKVRLQANTDAFVAGVYRWLVWEDNDRFMCGGPVYIQPPEVIP